MLTGRRQGEEERHKGKRKSRMDKERKSSHRTVQGGKKVGTVCAIRFLADEERSEGAQGMGRPVESLVKELSKTNGGFEIYHDLGGTRVVANQPGGSR